MVKTQFKSHPIDRGVRWVFDAGKFKASFSYIFINNVRSFRYSFGGTLSVKAGIYGAGIEDQLVLDQNIGKPRTRAEADKYARAYFKQINIRKMLLDKINSMQNGGQP